MIFMDLLLFLLYPETGLHNWAVNRLSGSSHGKKTMTTVAKIISTTGYDLLTKPEIIEEAKGELNQRLGGQTYKTLLPDDAKPDLQINKDAMDKFR